MSWGAIVGFHFIISAVIGALVGIAVFIFARKPNYGGVKSISTIGGMGSFFATVGLIIWAIKAFI